MSINVKPFATALASILVSAATAGAPVVAAGSALGVATQLVQAVIEGVNVAEQVYDGLKGSQKAALVLADVKQLAASLGVNTEALWAKIERPLQQAINFTVALYNLLSLWPFKTAPTAPAPGGTPVAI